MKVLFAIAATLLCLTPVLAPAVEHSYIQGRPVIRSFHLGPYAPKEPCETPCEAEAPAPANDCCDSEPTLEASGQGLDPACVSPYQALYYNPPPCKYCEQCNYQHWCPYCGYCPIYDETDVVSPWEHPHWPGQNEDSWMFELYH